MHGDEAEASEGEASAQSAKEKRTYPQKLEKYQLKREELRSRLKRLSRKEQQARLANAEENGIKNWGSVTDNERSSRSRSSRGGSPEMSEFAPSGSNI